MLFLKFGEFVQLVELDKCFIISGVLSVNRASNFLMLGQTNYL